MIRTLTMSGAIANVIVGTRPVRIYHLTNASAIRITRLIEGRVPAVWAAKYSYPNIWFSYDFDKPIKPRPRLDSAIVQARLHNPSQPSGSYLTERLSAT